MDGSSSVGLGRSSRLRGSGGGRSASSASASTVLSPGSSSARTRTRRSRVLVADELGRGLDAAGVADARGELDGGLDVILFAVLLEAAGHVANEVLVVADAGNVGGLAASNVGSGDVRGDAAVLFKKKRIDALANLCKKKKASRGVISL